VLEKSDTPNSSYYSIATLDKYMTFGKLAVGSYNYRITTTDQNGTVLVLDQCFSVTSSTSVTSSVTLSAPALSSVKIPSTGGIQLTWSQVDGADGYYIFRSENGASASLLQTISSGSTKTYTDTSVKDGRSYTYTLYAFSGSTQSSGSSKSITYTAPSTLLSTPKLTSVTNSSSGVVIQWGAVSGAAKYRVFYKTEDSGWQRLADTTSTSAVHTDTFYGTTYTYTVRCITSNGKSYTSKYDTTGLSILATGPKVSAPVLTSVTNSSDGVVIQWEAVPGAAKYRVFYKTEGGSWQRLVDTTSTEATHTEAVAGTTYTYTVRCLASNGKSYTSTYDTTGLSITHLVAPVLTSVSNTSAGVVIRWEAFSGAAKYRVFYKTADSGWQRLADTTSTEVTHTEAIAGTTYAYTVRCITSDGKHYTSKYDTTGLSILATGPKTAAPVLTSVTNSSGGVVIQWEAVSGAAKYRVFYKTEDGSWKRLVDTTSTSAVHTNTSYGTTYTYTVRCITSDGKSYTGKYDTTGLSILATGPRVATPVLTSVTNSSSGVTIRWEAVPGATKYRVFYKTEGGSWQRLTDTTSTSAVHTNAISGTTYTYTVRCITSDGSDYTSSYDSAGLDILYLSIPKVTVSSVSGGIRLSWDSISGAASYRLYRKTAGGSWKRIANLTSTSYTDTSAERGTTYYYAVRAVSGSALSAYTSSAAIKR
jgi:hypothetical protein